MCSIMHSKLFCLQGQFEQSTPLQSPQAATQSKPFARQEHLELLPQGFFELILQLHLVTFKISSGAGGAAFCG